MDDKLSRPEMVLVLKLIAELVELVELVDDKERVITIIDNLIKEIEG